MRPYKEAIETKLTLLLSKYLGSSPNLRVETRKQQGKYNEMVQTLIDEYGYNEESAEEVIKFAANNLWRDS